MMHELSIAMSIVDLVQEEAQQRGNVEVSAVYVKLGALSGVVKEALLSSYEMVSEGTSLKGSRLIIDEIPVRVLCPSCGVHRPVSSVQMFCCAECGTPTGDVVEGRDLEVVALEIQQ